jgi:hypothetical protein
MEDPAPHHSHARGGPLQGAADGNASYPVRQQARA